MTNWGTFPPTPTPALRSHGSWVIRGKRLLRAFGRQLRGKRPTLCREASACTCVCVLGMGVPGFPGALPGAPRPEACWLPPATAGRGMGVSGCAPEGPKAEGWGQLPPSAPPRRLLLGPAPPGSPGSQGLPPYVPRVAGDSSPGGGTSRGLYVLTRLASSSPRLQGH